MTNPFDSIKKSQGLSSATYGLNVTEKSLLDEHQRLIKTIHQPGLSAASVAQSGIEKMIAESQSKTLGLVTGQGLDRSAISSAISGIAEHDRLMEPYKLAIGAIDASALSVIDKGLTDAQSKFMAATASRSIDNSILKTAFAGVAQHEMLFNQFKQEPYLRDLQAKFAAASSFASHLPALSNLTTAHSILEQLKLPSVSAVFLDAMRYPVWAGSIGAMGDSEISKLMRASGAVMDQFAALKASVLSIDAAFPKIETSAAMLAGLSATSNKLSLYAGAVEVYGALDISAQAAFGSLLGTYHSHVELPPEFYRDREARARMYREAEVDEGLIDADKAAAIEVMVESGVAAGARTRQGSLVALFEVGPLTMRIAASRPRAGTYELIDGIEAELRDFITEKLMAVVREKLGDAKTADWFKLRTPPDTMKKAKERRRAALLSGEPHRPLIEFTELGDLMHIILRTDNWDEAFEVVFEKRDHLKVDLERLIAIRRPTAHGRNLDGVQVTEAALVVRRLQGQMVWKGPLDAGWDDDR